ncbi:MAG: radical SAM protein [Candidatus Helarchaeota archaeon]
MPEPEKSTQDQNDETEINLSKAMPITASLDETIRFTYKDVMETEVDKRYFLRRLKKELGHGKINFDVEMRNDDFFLKFDLAGSVFREEEIISVFKRFLSELMNARMWNAHTGRPMMYIHEKSGIPLIGHTAFGIIVRGTNVIEVRPISGCPLQCIFCSVDEGKNSKSRQMDYLVDPDYLFQEVQKIVEFLGPRGLEIHLSGQGEPTTYPYLAELITRLNSIEGIEEISLQTNGILLDEDGVLALEKAGLTRINLSLNCLNPRKARALAGTSNYDIEHVKKLIDIILRTKIKLHVSPIVVPRVNVDDMNEIIQYLKKMGLGRFYKAPLGIQNYLIYPLSRKVKGIKPWTWEEFHDFLHELEQKHAISSLILDKKRDFNMVKRKELPKPFRKGEVVMAEIKALGRIKGEILAVARNRIIQIIDGKKKVGSTVRIKIERTKNNIFTGRLIG